MEGYRHVAEVDVRFRDLDLMGHVNNATTVTYLEEARVSYYDEVAGAGVEELGFVLAHIEVDYERPIEHGDDVRIGVRTVSVGDKSMTTEYRIEASGNCAATAESVQVSVDEGGKPRALPDEWRRAVAEYEGLQ